MGTSKSNSVLFTAPLVFRQPFWMNTTFPYAGPIALLFLLKNYFYNFLTQTTTVSLRTSNSTGTLGSADSKRPEEPIPDTTGGSQGRLTDDQRPLSTDRDGNVSPCHVLMSSMFICVSMQLFAYPLMLGQQETGLSLTPGFPPKRPLIFFFFFFFSFGDKVSLCSPGCSETHYRD